MTDLPIQYTYHLAFQALRPVRKRYKLTVNMVLVLNAAYLYQKHVGTCFAVKGLRDFFTYYQQPLMGKFIQVLCDKGFMYQAEFNHFAFYKLTERGVEVVEKLQEGYVASVQRFTDKYKVQL